MAPIALNAAPVGDEEIAAVVRVMRTGHLVQGAEVAAFEDEFSALVAGRHCVAVNSGTAALHLSLLAHGVGPGAEVIVPSFTFGATAHAVALTGATPVFADIDPASFCLDPHHVASLISARTAAIMPVHLFGHPADMTALMSLASRHHLAVIEDAAQAVAAAWRGQPVGTFGDAGCFSFYPTKNMHSIEGGMIATGDAGLAATLRLLRNQGMSSRYEYARVGLNARMTDVSAAVGRVQLAALGTRTRSRQSHAGCLNANLRGVLTPPVAQGAIHVYHRYVVRAQQRDRLAEGLRRNGIAAAWCRSLDQLGQAHVLDESRQCPVGLAECPRQRERVEQPRRTQAGKVPVDYYSAAFYLANPELPNLRANTIAVRRFRFVGNGILEQLGVVNSGLETVRFELRLACGTDFADLFEMKSVVRDRSELISCGPGSDPGSIRFGYEVPAFRAACIVRALRAEVRDATSLETVADQAVRINGQDLVWEVQLAPGHMFSAHVRVELERDGVVLQPIHEDFGDAQEMASEGALTKWLEKTPRFESDNADLKAVLEQSVVDLAALRIEGDLAGEHYVLPAAGLPWFMTLFGRDTLITSLQTLWVGPELARGALYLLGELQGTQIDDFRDEEPGKILHEIRHGELTVRGEKPHSPYFGTADATPLWLILLSDYWRHTADDQFVRDRWPRVLAALQWIERHGDLDGDGYIEYATRSTQGLGNQCWKDSWDGIQFHDGRIPFLPIAAAEIQGYAFDAKLRAAELAEQIMGDSVLAAELTGQAEDLFARFNRDFWTDDRGGYYAVGLDADKQPIDSITSNLGHLLWSGIVPHDRAGIVVQHLLSDELFSGWGVRTLSTQERGFNPIGYHSGTIWPHDNSIITLGLARYGYRDEANRIAMAQLEAATHTNFRLPEAFAGFPRVQSAFPVPYPTACSPQAWATGASFAFVKTILGLEIRDREIRLDPHVPDEIGRIQIRNLPAFGTRWDIEATGTRGFVRLAR